MEHTFYCPSQVDISEMMGIVKKLSCDLEELVTTPVPRKACIAYATSVVSHGLALPHDPSMVFWGLQPPESMPSDARVDFFYMPTYYTVAIVLAMLEQEMVRLGEIPQLEDTLRRGMKACTGRKLLGHGYEDIDGLVDAMEIFAKGKAFSFCKHDPYFCDAFTECLKEAYAFVRQQIQNETAEENYGQRLSARMETLHRQIRGQSPGLFPWL